MEIISLAIGAVGGSVAAVVSSKVYAFVKKQVTSVKADAPAVVAKVEATAKKAV